MLNRFDFDQDAVFNNQICYVVTDYNTVVPYLYKLLLPYSETLFIQLRDQSILVYSPFSAFSILINLPAYHHLCSSIISVHL